MSNQITSLYQWWCLWVHTSDDLALTMTFELYLDLTWQVLYCHSWYLHLCCHRANQHCKRRSQHRNSIRRAESSSTTLTQHGVPQVFKIDSIDIEMIENDIYVCMYISYENLYQNDREWHLCFWCRKFHGINQFCPSNVAARHTGITMTMIMMKFIVSLKSSSSLYHNFDFRSTSANSFCFAQLSPMLPAWSSSKTRM